MEDIKTNFDKIMEQFSDSISHGAPKRLSFEYANESFNSSIPKKRKLSPERNSTPVTTKLDDSFNKNSSHDSLNTSVVSSPWESRRLRADLIEAKSRIAKLKKEIEHQHTIRSNMEIMYNNKTTSLQQQCDFTSNKVLDMEKHLTSLRKRENVAKNELVKLKNQLNQQKQSYEDMIYVLQKTNKELEEKSRSAQNKLSNEVNEYKRQLEKLQMDFNLAYDELNTIKETQHEYKEKAALYDEVKSNYDVEKQQHDVVKSKIKELEYEIASYGEWKEFSKANQTRLSNMPDLEREVTRLRQENKNLRDSLGNKLILEEQVFDLQTRLSRYEQIANETSSLKVQINAFEQELKEWKQLAADHCIPNTPQNAMSLRSRLEQLLQKDVILTSEKDTSKSEKVTIESQLKDLEAQNEIYTKANNELRTALKHQKCIMIRVQKKLILVAKERDCYKQLLENFEKDLTITGTLVDNLNPDSQLKVRLDMLERTLGGYKDMCSNLEKELASSKYLPEIPLDIPTNMESYDRLKKEIETLRIENERIRRRKEELELEMEHRCLKGDFNVDKVKVVHMTMNPAAEKHESSQLMIEKLQAEIERLKRRNRKLEEEQEEMTSRLNETTNLTVNIRELNTLRAELESTNARIIQMKTLYKSASREFREVCYMLFGYRIDRVGTANYRISSLYAESEDDYLNFRLNESGILDMLETNYSRSLGDLMRTQLETYNSLPAFLSTLTLELFTKTTVVQ